MKVKIISDSNLLPRYETQGSSGMDLMSNSKDTIIIEAGKWGLIPTGIHIEIPQGYEAQIRARSGLSVKKGIGLINGVGTIDSDYRGEIKIGLFNFSDQPFEVNYMDRIGQIVFAKYERVDWVQVDKLDELEDTKRGQGGFGHTGV